MKAHAQSIPFRHGYDVPPKSARVKLRLTPRQASVFLALHHMAVGGPLFGPRGDMDAIAEALLAAGIERAKDVIVRGNVRMDATMRLIPLRVRLMCWILRHTCRREDVQYAIWKLNRR